MDDLGERSKAVGGARGVGDDSVLGVVGVKVDTADEHGSVGGRSRDDDLLGSTLKVGRGLVLCEAMISEVKRGWGVSGRIRQMQA